MHGLDPIRVLLPYVVALVFAGACFATCILLLRGLKGLQAKVVRSEEDLRSAKATWTESLAALGKQVETIEAARHPSGALDANAATRRKVIKMHRLGSSVDQIAKALRLSKGEVILLLKVHTIILRPFEQSAGDRPTPVMEQKV